MDSHQEKRGVVFSPASTLKAGSIRLFSLFGIKIYLNYTWFIVVLLVAWSLSYGYFPQVIPGRSYSLYWGLGLLTSLVFFTCILLHEIAHSWVSVKLGIPVPRITLFIFGGVAQISREPQDPVTEFKIALAGPLTSAFLFGLFLAFHLLFENFYHFPVLAALFGILAWVNAAVTIFNLVPGFPLDGGRILRAYLWRKKRDLKKATFITSQVGKIFAAGLIFFGFFQMLIGSIVNGLWFIFIGFFLEQAASSGYQQVLMREGLAGTKVEEIMTRDVVFVDENLSLRELVEEFFFKYRFDSYPVVKDGEFVGCITLEDVKKFPKDRWDEVKVKDTMDRLPQQLLLHPQEEAVEALSKMVRSGQGRLPVVEKGRLIGILTRRDIMAFLHIRTDLGFH